MEKIALTNDEAEIILSADTADRQYLVQSQIEETTYTSLLRAEEIIERKNMSDCTGEELVVYDISLFGHVEQLTLRGPWSDLSEPLKIWAENTRGEIVFAGYGTEH